MPAAQRQLIDVEPAESEGRRGCAISPTARRPTSSPCSSAKEEQTTKDGKPYFRVTFRDARPRGELSHLDRRAAGRRVPRRVDGRQVLQAAGRVPRNELRPAARHPPHPRGERRRRGRRLRPGDVPAAVAARAGGDVRRAARARRGATSPTRRVAARRHDAARRQPRARCSSCPAATYNHHAYAGGFLEHVLSVAQTCVYLADKYADVCPELAAAARQGPGHRRRRAARHRQAPRAAAHAPPAPSTPPAGALIGHILQGRDMLREAAAKLDFDGEQAAAAGAHHRRRTSGCPSGAPPSRR